MKRYLALAVAVGMLSFTGCSYTSDGVNSDESAQAVQQPTEKEALPEKDQIKRLNESELKELSVNELGEVMVLMYHSIGYPEATWTRTPENFARDLEELYIRGFRAISLTDYASGNIDVEAGFTPVVITFDDGNENNFKYIEGEDGSLVIDPACAVGVMEEFKKKHPDFNASATFFVNANPFRNEQQAKDKIDFLIQNNYDIGNHTWGHADLSNTDSENTKKQLADIVKLIKNYAPDYEVNTLALPFGGLPDDVNKAAVYSGTYEGTSYENICVLRVGWDPYKSPFHNKFDALNVHRVRASETNVDNVGLYDWLKRYDEGKKTRFISDGDPSTIAIPEGFAEVLREDISDKEVITY